MDFQSAKSFGKLRLRAFQPYHQTIYVDTVDTRQGSLMHQCYHVDTVDTVFNHSNLYKVLCKSHKHQSTNIALNALCALTSYQQCRHTRYPIQYTIALL